MNGKRENLDPANEDRRTVHGVLLAVFGRGVLIVGPSGCGKSNLALEMIDRGHALVADDSVELVRCGDRVVGRAPKLTSRALALRGVGVLDVLETFGPSSFLPEIDVQYCVQLAAAPAAGVHDREPEVREFHGISLPALSLSGAASSTFACLIETWLRIAGAGKKDQDGGHRIGEIGSAAPFRTLV